MFEKLVNFRDLGGIEAEGGKKIKSKMLFRSGELANISINDVTELEKLGLATIVDMRTASEVSASPNEVVPGTKSFYIDFFAASDVMGHVTKGTDAGEAPSQENMFKHMASVNPDEYMTGIYKDIIENTHAQNGFKEFFRIVLEEKPAILWHCYAGKDRTGISGALLLTVLGVSKEHIMEDYLETNVLRKATNDAMMEDLKAKQMPIEMIENIETMMYVKASYLEATYAAIEELSGTIEAFIQDVLEIPAADIVALRAKYLI